MKKAIIHGEAMLVESSLPKGAKLKKTVNSYEIIAKSEVSFNHHVIDVVDGVEFYEKDGKLFMKNNTETQVRCVIAERHDTIVVPCGIWEIDIQQEYDPFEQRARAVRD